MNSRSTPRILLVIVLLLFVSTVPVRAGRVAGSDLNKVAQSVADTLDANLLYMLDRTAPILYSNFVDLSNLETTSRMGVLLGDQVASRFSQHGFRLVELKLMKNVVVMKQNIGEFALSRDIQRVVATHDAQAVLVGTYTLSGDRLFISAKLVGSEDNIILSSCYLSHRLDDDLLALSTQTAELGGKYMGKISEEKIHASEMGPLAGGMILLNPKNNTDAKLIQSRLSQLDYYSYKIDGMWGKRSRDALVRFKKDRGLTGGTRYDMDTQKMLFQ